VIFIAWIGLKFPCCFSPFNILLGTRRSLNISSNLWKMPLTKQLVHIMMPIHWWIRDFQPTIFLAQLL
jgi:hypothetical protein